MSQTRILIACVGNIFLGDDAFGIEVARRLAMCRLPREVRVIDFGIRGLDLTYALLEDYDAAILVDAAPHGQAPGTLYLIEPQLAQAPDPSDPAEMYLQTHGMDPVKVLRLVLAMGGQLKRLLLVGCEPTPVNDEMDMMGLSPPVQAAVDQAVGLIESLVEKLLDEFRHGPQTALDSGKGDSGHAYPSAS